MKGLLIKDFCIIMKNKKLFGIVIFLMVFLFLAQEEGIGSFMISYMTILGGSLVLTTIATDEFDRSTTFLMTMPIKPGTYAIEKYVFSFGCSVSCWLISTVACCIIEKGSVLELITGAFLVLIALSLFQLIMIPVQLKFGGENGRIVLMGIIVAAFAVGLILKRIASATASGQETVQALFQGIFRFFESLKTMPVLIAMVIAFSICVAVSIGISIRIMEKREY